MSHFFKTMTAHENCTKCGELVWFDAFHFQTLTVKDDNRYCKKAVNVRHALPSNTYDTEDAMTDTVTLADTAICRKGTEDCVCHHVDTLGNYTPSLGETPEGLVIGPCYNEHDEYLESNNRANRGPNPYIYTCHDIRTLNCELPPHANGVNRIPARWRNGPTF